MEERSNTLKSFKWRVYIAVGFLILLSMVLLLRVGYLQVYRFEEFQLQAHGNRIQVLPTISVRGNIWDRNGVLLAGNSTSFDLKYYPAHTSIPKEHLIDFLQKNIDLTPEERNLIEKSAPRRNRKGLVLREQLSEKHIAKISAHYVLKTGLEINSRLTRYYPESEQFGHITGYIGRISERDKERISTKGVERHYWGIKDIGKSGLELQYENELRGTPGSNEVEVDASGRIVRALSENPPIPGQDLVTTLDVRLQKVAHELLQGGNGSIVALDPNNGEVLSLLSKANYDPNIFIEEKNSEIRALFKSKDRPLLNRAISGVYPPASTFKPFVGLIGLSLGKRSIEDEIQDPGYFSLPGSTHRYRDWKIGGHGKVDFQKSLRESVDTYYYGLAVSIGIDMLSKKLKSYGFGMRTGIDLPGERSGLLPTPAWKERRFKQDWFAGDTVSVGVGQGFMLATPLQMAFFYSILANNGKGYQPHLLKHKRDPVSGVAKHNEPKLTREVSVEQKYWDAMKEALVAVNLPGGTGRRAFDGVQYQPAGKTGTAQVFSVAQDQKYSADKIKKSLHDHAWYVGYAPADNPKIVVAVMLENAGGGGANAAPIARKMMDAFFSLPEYQLNAVH